MKSTPSPRLRHLVDRISDGPPLDRAETAELEQLLRDDAALDYYLDSMEQSSALHRVLEAEPFVSKAGNRNLALRAKVIVLLTAAAAVVAMAFVLHREPAVPDLGEGIFEAEMPDEGQVTIASLVGLGPGGEGFAVGAPAPREMKWSHGYVDLRYARGHRVSVEGPAEIRLRDSEEMEIVMGRVRVESPAGVGDFLIRAADRRVWVKPGSSIGLVIGLEGPDLAGLIAGRATFRDVDGEEQSMVEGRAWWWASLAAGGGRGVAQMDLNVADFVPDLDRHSFPWRLDSRDRTRFDFNVSHLIDGPGSYRAIFKWLGGWDGGLFEGVTLSRDGEAVVVKPRVGIAGDINRTNRNVVSLVVDEEDLGTGRWMLSFDMVPYTRDIQGREGRFARANGVVWFEKEPAAGMTAEDFVGRWEFVHEGASRFRHYRADRTLEVGEGDSIRPIGPWMMRDRVLFQRIQNEFGAHAVHETTLIVSDGTLMFLNQPFPNAVRAAEED